MGCGVTHQTSQVFFGFPSHMVNQPVDFGSQLHIAFDTYLGLIASNPCRSQRQGGLFHHSQAQVKALKISPLQQSGGR
eukprot:gene32275-39856_t